MDNVLSRNEYWNDQTIYCSQTLRLDAGVEIGEICVHWDNNHDFKPRTILHR